MLCWGLFQRIASSILRGSGPEDRYSALAYRRVPLLGTLTRYSECGQPRPRAEQAARVRDALESKSLLRAANPHLYLLSMGARPHRLALYPF